MTTPYYSDDLVTLYHGDCREVTEWLEADVLVTDPPYGVGGALSMKGRHKNYRPKPSETHAWDADVTVRDAAVLAWGDRPYAVFGSPRRPEFALPCRQAPLIWDKGEAVGMGDTTFPWRPSYEVIFVNGPGWSGRRTTSIIRFALNNMAAANEGHPTPKPVGLMQTLIHKAAPGVIADPFAGSGSTLVAAKQLGRRAIGVEIDERYWGSARARVRVAWMVSRSRGVMRSPRRRGCLVRVGGRRSRNGPRTPHWSTRCGPTPTTSRRVCCGTTSTTRWRSGRGSMRDYFALTERIQELRDEVCCPSYQAAARALCGCKGIAAEELRRLEEDLDREWRAGA